MENPKNQTKQTRNQKKIPKGKSSTSPQIFLAQNMAENMHLVEHSCVVV